jgi:hypothetical protein
MDNYSTTGDWGTSTVVIYENGKRTVLLVKDSNFTRPTVSAEDLYIPTYVAPRRKREHFVDPALWNPNIMPRESQLATLRDQTLSDLKRKSKSEGTRLARNDAPRRPCYRKPRNK